MVVRSRCIRLRKRTLVEFVVLPFLFLTVALLGGLRIGAENGAFIFIAPPLVTLLLTAESGLSHQSPFVHKSQSVCLQVKRHRLLV